MRIHTWPDPILAVVADPVDEINDEIRDLVADMFDTMYRARGVGLAAPQVGVSKRIVVVDHKGAEGPLVLINPVIKRAAGKMEMKESCLSLPGVSATVERSKLVEMSHLDIDGNEQSFTTIGFKAVALQHECDHLDGRLFIDRLSRVKRDVLKRKILKRRGHTGLKRRVRRLNG